MKDCLPCQINNNNSNTPGPHSTKSSFPIGSCFWILGSALYIFISVIVIISLVSAFTPQKQCKKPLLVENGVV